MVLKRWSTTITQAVINTFYEASRNLQGAKNVKIVRLEFTVHPNVTPVLDLDEFYFQLTKSSQAAIIAQSNNQCVYKWQHRQVGTPAGNSDFQITVENIPSYRAEGLYFGFDTHERAATSLDSVDITVYYQEYKGGY